MRPKCYICKRPGTKGLCPLHDKIYVYDGKLKGFRLKKRANGSRYTQADYHKTEIQLTKIIEDYYGPSNVVTSYHPLWAKTPKGVLYEYDIYIISKNTLVEMQGAQHTEFVPFFHRILKNFKKQVRRDKKKAKLAVKNNTRLITFNYDEPLFKDYIINKIEATK